MSGEGLSVEAVVAVLEVLASERPELLAFELEALLNSPFRFAVQELHGALGVRLEELALVLYAASADLGKLEQLRRAWRDPRKVLSSPNVPCLLILCRARLGRIRGVRRRHKLEVVLRKLGAAHEHARSRAWIEDFIGPPLPQRQEVSRADR